MREERVRGFKTEVLQIGILLLISQVLALINVNCLNSLAECSFSKQPFSGVWWFYKWQVDSLINFYATVVVVRDRSC
jgi:hypothetical protein